MRLSERLSIVVASVAICLASTLAVHADDDKLSPVFAGELPNLPGQTLTVVRVDYPPGGKSSKHHHAGSVLAYVLSGTIRSENSTTGPSKTYKAGESFFEPAGSEH